MYLTSEELHAAEAALLHAQTIIGGVVERAKQHNCLHDYRLVELREAAQAIVTTLPVPRPRAQASSMMQRLSILRAKMPTMEDELWFRRNYFNARGGYVDAELRELRREISAYQRQAWRRLLSRRDWQLVAPYLRRSCRLTTAVTLLRTARFQARFRNVDRMIERALDQITENVWDRPALTPVGTG